ncbi:hypothetical protein, partial [Treponema sp. R6D11]
YILRNIMEDLARTQIEDAIGKIHKFNLQPSYSDFLFKVWISENSYVEGLIDLKDDVVSINKVRFYCNDVDGDFAIDYALVAKNAIVTLRNIFADLVKSYREKYEEIKEERKVKGVDNISLFKEQVEVLNRKLIV